MTGLHVDPVTRYGEELASGLACPNGGRVVVPNEFAVGQIGQADPLVPWMIPIPIEGGSFGKGPTQSVKAASVTRFPYQQRRSGDRCEFLVATLHEISCRCSHHG
jgi:hypothetical protein